MKAVMISTQPKWCELIASGQKTVEMRNTKPKIDTPFKCYIYCTNGKLREVSNLWSRYYANEEDLFSLQSYKAGMIGNGKVIGEFVCDGIDRIECWSERHKDISESSCLTMDEIIDYCGGKDIYAWHISDLKIYDKPKELSEFRYPCQRGYNSMNNAWCYRERGKRITNCKYNDAKNNCCDAGLTRPPQGWCYVEEKQ